MAHVHFCKQNCSNGFLFYNRLLKQQLSKTQQTIFAYASTAHDIPEFSRGNTIRVRGMDLIREPHLNKGTAFSLEERQLLNLHGLLPPAFLTQEAQCRRVLKNLRNAPDDLSRYVQLVSLQDRNEKLFYRILMQNIEELLPIIYTPTVGLACQNYGFIFRKPKGLYITIHDNTVDRIYNILCNWPESNIKAIVVTDGERILGLGDLGACGMGIPVGKMALYVAFARIQPRWCLPILLDVGTNNKSYLNDPFYIGIKQKRVKGVEYDYFVDNFMKAVTLRFGYNVLIQFEDFANHNAFRLLDRYKDKYCVFNDDIQGTAAVALAGLIGACKISGSNLADQRLLFFGAGEAATGIAMLSCVALERLGMSKEEARSKIFMMDIKGLLVKGRKDLDEHRDIFAKDMEPLTNLLEIIEKIKPTCIMGASSVQGAFDQSVIELMCKLNERPTIFALSNPTSRAECTAEQAYQYSNGKAIFASGSPFGLVKFGGKSYSPSQGNNAYIFPGVGLAIALFQVRHVPDDLFLIAAEVLSSLLTREQMEQGRVYPPLTDIPEISVKIAAKCADYCYKQGLAWQYPEPEDKEEFIRESLYDCEYHKFKSEVYNWPDHVMKFTT